MSTFSISDIKTGASVHMIGIGGISMSALAEILSYFGYKVSGSDAHASAMTEKLQKNNIDVKIGQCAENIPQNAALICYTAAISDKNPELVAARKLGIPVIERAELLGAIMEKYKYPIAVAGTHGKTTTTSMLSLALLNANTDPTILVGGNLPEIGGNYRIGGDEYLPFEACEYVESFLHFHPYVSIITNVDEDHLDYFKDIEHIITSFGKFASLTHPLGCIIVCSDDKNAPKVVQNTQKKVIYYGVKNQNAHYTARNIKISEDGLPTFDIYHLSDKLTTVSLSVAGDHNILNAVAVIAAIDFLGIDIAAATKGLEAFKGTERRFEHIGKVGDIDVVDDYAHHPTEIRATLETAKKMQYKNVWTVFQPHTYTRTKALLDDFAEALKISDKVIIADVYPAREEYDGTIHSCDLALKIPNGVYINDFGAIERYLRKYAKDGDLIITMGAGDVWKIGYSMTGK